MNAEKEKAMQQLKTARGQIDGILKMIDEGRYCVDISNQIIAVQSLLKKANMLILKQHLNYCVKAAFKSNSGEEKIDEVMDILEKLIGK
ncbi:DNA-binding transcriptional regulator, FrmR family [Caloramator quimbayensis]|uniref:Copper-sensing transcriptional repressor CsoR n=1 Tax=Caloramator quimbayensis TaxID=1147123 RepID=A0A1T4XTM6_9CLOT|nr:metal-sensing transcriptional repressor [Caloramator quimbayensis]SKA92902.1 DNA-binding transcriptional regulator, FrmR family [Caloramator quimbayensis]